MAECSRGRVGEGVFRLLRGRPWLGAGGGEECLTEGERHVGVQEVSTTTKLSIAGVGEPEGKEEVRGRRGCQGEPLRGRNRCRGMVKPGICRKSAEPGWKMRNARKTMKTTDPELKPNSQAIIQKRLCITLCVKAVEGGWFNAPPIGFECNLMFGGGGCHGHEPSTWLRAPLASPFRFCAPSVGH
jgi:hypothetical protein